MKEKNVYVRNLTLTIIETILTSVSTGFSVAVINLFWNSIGMNQTDIGFTQMMFNVAIVSLDIPMGYLADRFNRKVLNIVGDLGVAFTFLLYAFAQNMYMAILSECLLAVFMAMTNGVDQSFIKFNADKIDPTGQLFKKVNARVFTLRYIVTFSMMFIGGFVSKYSLRLTVGLSFIPYFVGGIIAFFINDYAKRIEKKHDNVLKDMLENYKEMVKDKQTRTYLLSYIAGKEISHPHIWIFTPLMIMVGVPVEVVSLGWIFSEVFKILGAKVSEKIVNLQTSTKFCLLVAITFFWMSVLIVSSNIWTVWLFVLNGFVVGLFSGSMITPLQENTKEEHQTSVMSLASTGARLLYIPLVFVINFLGNIKLQLAFVGMILIFLPISLFVYLRLIQCEKIMD